MIAKWIIITAFCLSTLASILSIGKPRNPLTPEGAAWIVITNAILVALTVVFWRA